MIYRGCLTQQPQRCKGLEVHPKRPCRFPAAHVNPSVILFYLAFGMGQHNPVCSKQLAVKKRLSNLSKEELNSVVIHFW